MEGHTGNTSQQVEAAAFAVTTAPATAPVHEPPSGPSGRLKPSRTGVAGNGPPPPATVTITVSRPIPPWPSSAVSTAANVPPARYVWLGLAAEEPRPSPKFHDSVSGSRSGSTVPSLENETESGALPTVGMALAFAMGGVLAPTCPVQRIRRTSPARIAT